MIPIALMKINRRLSYPEEIRIEQRISKSILRGSVVSEQWQIYIVLKSDFVLERDVVRERDIVFKKDVISERDVVLESYQI